MLIVKVTLIEGDTYMSWQVGKAQLNVFDMKWGLFQRELSCSQQLILNT